MKVDKEDKQEFLAEGGDDGAEASGPKSKEEKWAEKSKDFSATECGMNAETGINLERGCTDMLCVVLFLCFIATMLGTAFYGIAQGNPKAMIKPYDFNKQICGVNETVKDYGKLYFTKLAPGMADILDPTPTELVKRITFERAVCVKECPKKKGEPIECPPGEEYQNMCDGITSVETTSVMDLCWPHYSSLSDKQKSNWKLVIKLIEKNPVFTQLLNLQTAYKAILFSMVSAFLLCVIYIYFMSFFAQYVAWGIIFLTQLSFIVLALASFYYITTVDGDDEDASTKKGIAGVIGIVFGILACIFALIIYCKWDDLKLAIQIVDASADFIAATKRILLTPIIYYVFLFLFFLFWLSCIICVESMGRIVPNPGDKLTYIPFDKKVEWDDRREQGKIVNYMLFFLCFGLIWFTFFLQASSNYIVMVTAATYYFSSSEEAVGSGAMMTGFKWAWVNNFGSLAFGSLLVAIIFTIRVIAYYLFKKAEKMSNDNALVKCISCLVQCFLKCLEDIIEYITKAAYAFMALSGQSFCYSAYNGLLLQMKHGARFAFGAYLANIFVMLGKLGLTVLNIFITYMFMKHVTGSASQVSNPFAPLIIVAITSYMIVSVFLGLFDESVLSMMTSCSADLDLNGDLKWGPKSLHDVIDSINEGRGHGKDEDEKKANDIN